MRIRAGAAESAFIGAKNRAIPVFFAGMIDTVGPEHGRIIQNLVTFFLPRCGDQSTVRELEEMAADNNRWRHGPGREWPGPFDPDSPSWVLPIAVGFARALGLEDSSEVIK